MKSLREPQDIRDGSNRTEQTQTILLIAESITDATAVADSILTRTATDPIKASSRMQIAINAAETALLILLAEIAKLKLQDITG
jgi:hypothetical protein